MDIPEGLFNILFWHDCDGTYLKRALWGQITLHSVYHQQETKATGHRIKYLTRNYHVKSLYSLNVILLNVYKSSLKYLVI